MRAIHFSWGAAVSQAARLTAFAVLVGAVGSVPAVQAETPTYRIVPLGLADPSDPASIILPIAINDLGVVVSFAYRTNELPEALRWFNGTSTVLQPLPVEPPYNQSLAQPGPINNHDEIVGTDLFSGQTSVQASAIWPASGGVVNLSALIAGESWATAINNVGQVVGYNKAPVTAGGPVHYRAFLYQNGAVTMLPPPETTGDSWADGINDSGVIIGTANFGTTQSGGIYNGGNWVRIYSPISQSDITGLSSINSNGWIVGEFSHKPSKGSDIFDLFLYKNGKSTRLYFPAVFADAPKMNNSGQIIEDTTGKDNDYATANGYLYQDGHWYVLDKLHSATDGYHVAYISGINANGVILASATLNGGSTLYGVQLVPQD